jgi:hypothetical protein
MSHGALASVELLISFALSRAHYKKRRTEIKQMRKKSASGHLPGARFTAGSRDQTAFSLKHEQVCEIAESGPALRERNGDVRKGALGFDLHTGGSDCVPPRVDGCRVSPFRRRSLVANESCGKLGEYSFDIEGHILRLLPRWHLL